MEDMENTLKFGRTLLEGAKPAVSDHAYTSTTSSSIAMQDSRDSLTPSTKHQLVGIKEVSRTEAMAVKNDRNCFVFCKHVKV